VTNRREPPGSFAIPVVKWTGTINGDLRVARLGRFSNGTYGQDREKAGGILYE